MDVMLERILSLIPHKENGDYVFGEKKKFAARIGLKSGNLISDWEKGRSKSYEGYVYEIAQKYNVSVDWLKGESEQKEKPATEVTGDGLDVIRDEIMPRVANLSQAEIIRLMGELAAYMQEKKTKDK